MSSETPPEALETRTGSLVDSVLLIDGDNDPHLPPEFVITQHTLARVFLRPQAKMPRGLERKLGHLPQCVAVVSPKGGANAADFVMSLHAGMLHAVLPMNIPFTLVTNDKSLAAMVQELQRIGRQALLWTSHPENRGAAASEPAVSRGRSGRGRAGSRRTPARGRRRSASAPVSGESATTMPVQATATVPSSVAPASSGKTLAQVASSYAARLGRIKDPPSRIKTLLNDIKNRAAASGFSPDEILEELKRSHGVTVDEKGKVHRSVN
jgi:hypothetical protein